MYKSRLSFSICINDTGMPEDGGQSTVDVSIYRNFDISKLSIRYPTLTMISYRYKHEPLWHTRGLPLLL